jgi:hypothetical protein
MATTIGGDHVSQTNRSAATPYVITWTSNASGAYSETIAIRSPGELAEVDFVPGSPAPTANYDIVLNDERGVDVLSGQGANLSDTTPYVVAPGIAVKDGTTTSVGYRFVAGNLSLAITNAGASKQGTIVLWVR